MKSLRPLGHVFMERCGFWSLADPLPAAGLQAFGFPSLTFLPLPRDEDHSIQLTGLAEGETDKAGHPSSTGPWAQQLLTPTRSLLPPAI